MVAQTVKKLLAMQETLILPLVRKIPWRKERLPTPVFLPGEFHGQRSLVGYSPWDGKESDMTEVTQRAHTVVQQMLEPLMTVVVTEI